MINPFDLAGPQFLVLYVLLEVLTLVIAYIFWRGTGDDTPLRRPLTDPYLIAYLRGGTKEAVRVCTASLVHRKWLRVESEATKINVLGIKISSSNQTSPRLFSEQKYCGGVTNWLEEAILKECLAGKTIAEIISGFPAAVAERLVFHHDLVSEHLILSDRQHRSMTLIRGVLCGVLLGVAMTKRWVAISHGKHNFSYLILLAVGGCIALLCRRIWRTPKGNVVLKDLEVLFCRLTSQTTTLKNEVENRNFTFLVAVFGLAALSTREFPFLSALNPPLRDSSDCSSSCGSGGCGGDGCGG